jgi:hypothetical protein
MSEPPERWHAWPEHRAAPGFADRVMAALGPERRGRARPTLMVAFAAGATVAALVAWVVGRGSATPHAPASAASAAAGAADGALVATARTHTHLGAAAIAVPEPGAVLRWQTRPGRLDVEQPRGRVFYRAERPLMVRTPVAALDVTGTSFAIESAPAHADLVVYEGAVMVVRGDRRTEVVAGHRVRITGRGIGPTRPTPWRHDEPAPPTGPVALAAPPLAHDCTVTENIFDPGAATLAAWAAECRLRFDVAPNGYDDSGLEHYLDQLAVTAAERAVVREVIRAVEARADLDLARAYLDATGDATPPDQLGVEWMFSEVMRSADPDEPAAVRRRLSRERAGLEPSPADLGLVTPYESQVRWVMRSGDVLERELAARLGAARGRELRARHGGWPGLRWNYVGCPIVPPD